MLYHRHPASLTISLLHLPIRFSLPDIQKNETLNHPRRYRLRAGHGNSN